MLNYLGTWKIYEELKGTIPYCKRGEHILTTYENGKSKTENLFRCSRRELDEICNLIQNNYFQ